MYKSVKRTPRLDPWGLYYDGIENINKYIQAVNSEFMPTTTFGFNNGNKSFYISDGKFIEDKNLAYYCRDYYCELPVESIEELLKQIKN